jgi:type IV pilus assembly protein PilE
MNKQTSKGFTIIELLVVVAIIAVLTAIVLVNVTQYIGRGRDAAAQGNLATMLTNGAVYYDTNSNFSAFNSAALTTGTIAAGTACAGSSGFTGPCNAITGTAANGYAFTYACSDSTGTAAVCSGTGNAVQNWAGMVTLKANALGATATFCVDSTGAKVLKLAGSVTAVAPNYGKCT